LRYKYIIFDADGTLWDFEKAQAQALRGLFDALQVNWKSDFEDVYKTVNKKIWSELEKGLIAPNELSEERFRRYFGALNHKVDAAEASRLFLHYLSKGRGLIDGSEDVLLFLQQKGCRMLLLTNGLKAVQRPRHEQSPIKAFFEDIVISEEVGVAKPDPYIFEVAFGKLGNPEKSDVLMVGDNPSSDIKGGMDFGTDTCFYNPSGLAIPEKIKATYTIRKLEEIKNIVDK